MTMIPGSDPWIGLEPASGSKLNRKRVDSSTAHNMFWVRNEAGQVGLLIGISSEIPKNELVEARISIRDIKVDVVGQDDFRAILILLLNNQNRDVFQKLCGDLIERIVQSQNEENLFRLVCKRLKKWQMLLAGTSRKLLSRDEVQGLFAELRFIADALSQDRSRETLIIHGWQSAEHAQHDFVLNDIAVEIKSLAGNQRGKVRISSEDQLETHLRQLYLNVYFMSEATSASDGESLNGLARRVEELLSDEVNRTVFETRLNAWGYIDIPEYDTPLFMIHDCHTHIVTDDFPRIVRSKIPPGLEHVSYDLVLANIASFRIENHEIWS